MSTEWWLSVLAALVIGVVSFIAGRVYERLKRVRFTVHNWRVDFVDNNQPNGTDFSDLDSVGRDNVTHIKYEFDVVFFNQKATPVSLRELSFGVYRSSRSCCRISESTCHTETDYLDLLGDTTHFVDLQPHQSTKLTFYGVIPTDDLDEFLECDRAILRGTMIAHKPVQKKWVIAKWRSSTR